MRLTARFVNALALVVLMGAACVQAAPAADDDAVVITAVRNPVDKSYRRMLAGVERFEARRHLAPDAPLRFRLLPRKRDTDMDEIDLRVVGESFETSLELAPDRSFALPRDALAWKERASVRPDRRTGSLTWRADIRTPGLPADTRRLGDLRLECEVGMTAGLISNYRPGLLGWLADRFAEGAEYCHRTTPRYLFFAERPIFNVVLVAGERSEALPVDLLYGGASRDPHWKDDLPYCDCEVLMDRAYFLPLGDPSWPDDTLIRFEYMVEAPSAAAARGTLWPGTGTKADVRAALGEAIIVDFDSGYEVWVYRERPRDKQAALPPELVLLFEPSGLLTKARLR